MIDISDTDCIVVGAGFCGSVIARKLAEADKKVLLVERRNHIAGNMYDEIDANGILVQRYGPHIFHTNEKQVYDFITAYGEWNKYIHRCAVEMEGVLTPSPANFKTIDVLYDKSEAETLKTSLQNRYMGEKSVSIIDLLESDDITIRKYAEKLFELNYRPYTVKQWGMPPEDIDSSILKRVPIRLDYTDAYFDDEYQVLPQKGYTYFFESLIKHDNITVLLNTDALQSFKIDDSRKRILFNEKPIDIPFVYTGSIDELLDNRYGRLPYRSLIFDFHTKNVDNFQNAPVVVHPGAKEYTRITEYKKLPSQNVPDITTIVYDFPLPADKANIKEKYYPVLTKNNAILYNKYYSELSEVQNLFLCGRLADYKYYNMDSAIMRAFEIVEKMITK